MTVNPFTAEIDAARREARRIGHASSSRRRFVAVAIPSTSEDGFRRPYAADSKIKPYVFARSDNYETITRRARQHALVEIVDRRPA